MLHQRLAYGVLAALAGFVSAEGDTDVHQLTQDTFGDFVKANDLVLAECEFPMSPLHEQLFAVTGTLADMCPLQSSPRGAVTARLLLPSTRSLVRLSPRLSSPSS